MSLKSIEEVIKDDPHVDSLDVTRLMFWAVTEPLRTPPKPKEIMKGIGALIDEGPVVGLAGALFLIATVPIGAIAEGTQRAYRAVKGG